MLNQPISAHVNPYSSHFPACLCFTALLSKMCSKQNDVWDEGPHVCLILKSSTHVPHSDTLSAALHMLRHVLLKDDRNCSSPIYSQHCVRGYYLKKSQCITFPKYHPVFLNPAQAVIYTPHNNTAVWKVGYSQDWNAAFTVCCFECSSMSVQMFVSTVLLSKNGLLTPNL